MARPTNVLMRTGSVINDCGKFTKIGKKRKIYNACARAVARAQNFLSAGVLPLTPPQPWICISVHRIFFGGGVLDPPVYAAAHVCEVNSPLPPTPARVVRSEARIENSRPNCDASFLKSAIRRRRKNFLVVFEGWITSRSPHVVLPYSAKSVSKFCN